MDEHEKMTALASLNEAQAGAVQAQVEQAKAAAVEGVRDRLATAACIPIGVAGPAGWLVCATWLATHSTTVAVGVTLDQLVGVVVVFALTGVISVVATGMALTTMHGLVMWAYSR